MVDRLATSAEALQGKVIALERLSASKVDRAELEQVQMAAARLKRFDTFQASSASRLDDLEDSAGKLYEAQAGHGDIIAALQRRARQLTEGLGRKAEVGFLSFFLLSCFLAFLRVAWACYFCCLTHASTTTIHDHRVNVT